MNIIRKVNRYLFLFSVVLLFTTQLSAQECKRIISLAASITKNLCLLDVKDRIVGCTQYCELSGKQNVPIVADAINVNIEKIVNLKPDIVIASGLTHPRIIAALQKMGIRTVHWHQPKTFNEICNQLEELGKICGKEETAKRYVRESNERLSQIAKPAQGKKIFFEQGANPLFTVLPDSFMNDYILLLGGKNICDDLKTGIVSREMVLVRNPDIILIGGMGGMNQTEIAEWGKYSTVNAVKNKQIFIVGTEACTPTPVIFVDVLEKLAKEIIQ
ncbi:MAG: helical backbone metal receptor [Odoribacter sp.]